MENVIIPDAIWKVIEFLKEDDDKPIVKIGRPTVMTNDVLQKLKQGFLMGYDDEEASAYAGIAIRTLYYFQEQNPEYLHLKEAWKRNPFLKAKATIYKSLEQMEGAQWYLERKKKDEFSTRREITGADGGGIELLLDKIENNKTDYGAVADNARSAMDSSGKIEG